MVAFNVSETSLPDSDTKTEEKIEPSSVWNVVVLNDPVNLMSYVSMIFRRVLGMSEQQAEKHMLEVHELGRSVVWSGNREKAESYVYELQSWHLTAILERNENA